MVEIYNEQVRDLLSSDSSRKRYPLIRGVLLHLKVTLMVECRVSSSSLLFELCLSVCFLSDDIDPCFLYGIKRDSVSLTCTHLGFGILPNQMG